METSKLGDLSISQIKSPFLGEISPTSILISKSEQIRHLVGSITLGNMRFDCYVGGFPFWVFLFFWNSEAMSENVPSDDEAFSM